MSGEANEFKVVAPGTEPLEVITEDAPEKTDGKTKSKEGSSKHSSPGKVVPAGKFTFVDIKRDKKDLHIHTSKELEAKKAKAIFFADDQSYLVSPTAGSPVGRASVAVNLTAYAKRHNLSKEEQQRLKELDDDDSGTLTMDEVLHSAIRLHGEKRKVYRLELAIAFVCTVFIIAMASVLGIALLANDLTKDMDTVGGVLVAREGGAVVETQAKVSSFSLTDYYYMPISDLQSTELVTFRSSIGHHVMRVSAIDKLKYNKFGKGEVVFHGYQGNYLAIQEGTAVYSDRDGIKERILPLTKKTKRKRALLQSGNDDDDEIVMDDFSATCSNCHSFEAPVHHSIWVDEVNNTFATEFSTDPGTGSPATNFPTDYPTK